MPSRVTTRTTSIAAPGKSFPDTSITILRRKVRNRRSSGILQTVTATLGFSSLSREPKSATGPTSTGVVYARSLGEAVTPTAADLDGYEYDL